jgi:squalene-hopene/tetraprenyl-beta-curcumene cyclase
VARARAALRAGQREDGAWDVPPEFDASYTAQHLLLTHYLGRQDPGAEAGMVRTLRALALPSGGWGGSPDGEALLDTTLWCYSALKAAGVPAADPVLRAGGAVVRRRGGVPAAAPLTRLVLVLHGQIPRDAVCYVTPRILSAPPWARPSLDDLGLFALGVVPAALLGRPEAVRPLPAGRGIQELLPARTRWRARPSDPAARQKPGERLAWAFLTAAGHVMRGLDRRLPPADCERLAHAWILGQRGRDGTWMELLPVTMLCLMALDASGDPSDRAHVDRGMATLESWLLRDGERVRQQFSPSTTHSTAYAVRGLLEAGAADDHRAARRGVRWLLDHQARERGAWAARAGAGVEPGGWCFGRHNARYADTDSTAIVLSALSTAPETEPAEERAVRWLLAMQDPGGGWAPYTRGLGGPLWRAVGGVYGPEAAYAFVPDEDVTARVLMVLGPRSRARDAAAVRSAIEHGRRFLLRRRRRDGTWFGRWVVGRVYGTAQAVEGLLAAGVPAEDARLAQSLAWIESVQGEDGGWGESKRGYATGRYEPGPSAPVATAFAVRALCAAGRAACAAVSRGIAFLQRSQEADGTWQDRAWSGVTLPRQNYCRYHLVPTSLALGALMRSAAISPSSGAPPSPRWPPR